MKTLEIKKLEFLLIELKEGAKELINYGSSREKREGSGMLEVIDRVRNLYKESYEAELRLEIDALLVSYLDGTYEPEFVESLTSDPDKIDFIVVELTEYYHEFCNPDTDHDPAQYYIDNIIRILND